MENHISNTYLQIRRSSEAICSPLETEDYVVQPIVDVSPPKWHLGHTTWFFETLVLKEFVSGYQEFDSRYNYVFNSYYETLGARVIRTDRGNLSRPSVQEVYRYRNYVDGYMKVLIGGEELDPHIKEIVNLGLQHEQQHQELLLTDIKFILGHNPLFPSHQKYQHQEASLIVHRTFVPVSEGIYEIGFEGDGFAFDNEFGRHKVWLHNFEIASTLVTNAEYLEFILAGGYSNFNYWHAEGWEWLKQNRIQSPLYWHLIDGEWMYYTLSGLLPLVFSEELTHVSYYEAAAFALWKGMRLPTESEWEVASIYFNWGKRWEWTNSAYLPYPGFRKAAGALGEYNGKFMINQMVLRGASDATPEGHSRKTYRNFFHPNLRWQMTGIRLVK